MKLDDDIHNYYEQLVLQRIEELKLTEKYDTNFIADLCCLTLNQVPPRYIRYDVDMAFYLPPQERQEMEMTVSYAVDKALNYLNRKI